MNREIAERLGRTEAAIRNIRYRENLKTTTKEKLPALTRERGRLQWDIGQLTQRHNLLSGEISSLQARNEQISKALQLGEDTLKTRIASTLTELKQQKPELFFFPKGERHGATEFTEETTFLFFWDGPPAPQVGE